MCLHTENIPTGKSAAPQAPLHSLRAEFPEVLLKLECGNAGWTLRAAGPAASVTVLLPGFPRFEALRAACLLAGRDNLAGPDKDRKEGVA